MRALAVLSVAAVIAGCAGASKPVVVPVLAPGTYQFHIGGEGFARTVDGHVRFERDSIDFEAEGCHPLEVTPQERARIGYKVNVVRMTCGPNESVTLAAGQQVQRWGVSYTMMKTVHVRKDACQVTDVDKSGREYCKRMGSEYEDHDVPTSGWVPLIPAT